MVNVNQVYGSGKYLKAEDLQNQKHVVTIEAVRTVTYDDGKVKLALSFVGKDKDLVLNKTNSTNVAEMYGPETDLWAGRNITLYSAFVDFQGKTVPAVRIEPMVPGAPNGMQAQAPIQQPVQNGGQQFAQQQQPLTPANEVSSTPASGHPFSPQQTQQTPFDDEVPF